jgi:hypothetical protein
MAVVVEVVLVGDMGSDKEKQRKLIFSHNQYSTSL